MTTMTGTIAAMETSTTKAVDMIHPDPIDQRIRKPAPYLAAQSETGTTALARLYLLRARLAIFLYRHPLDNTEQIMDVIDNTESTGEIQLLLDYVLARRVMQRGLRWTDSARAH